MNAVASQPETGTDIATVVAHNPAIVLIDAGKREDLFAHIRREVEAFEPDLTTAKGRDAIKSLAYKITRSKTAIDAAGKKLNEDARAQINAVDASRREAREKLDALAAQVRQPLTDWEEAEKARVDGCREDIEAFKRAGEVSLSDTAEDVRQRGMDLWNQTIDPDRFRDMAEEAQAAKDASVAALKTALARLEREEADRAELARLRADQEKREAEEAAKREESERAERKRQYARDIIEHIHQCGLGTIGGKTYPYVILIRELEEKIETGPRAETAFGDMADEVEKARTDTLIRLQDACKAQAEREQREQAEEAARKAREQAQREAEERHQKELAAERHRAEEAERAAQEERDRAAREAAEREAEQKRQAEEQAKREADQAHRTKVKSAAKAAIMSCGADEDTARKIVVAIIAGEVPHVRLGF
ncbi:hypothetical protein [Stakelama pacifica]|uniref:Uncharacterized protein n=1 Tax=Stakelama pacifica TaxID=517720 RepID=A0A4R6FK97_9SPHN|nr:hypothetical protein [Stakelama pacifica]TDN81737.1 hypothetical protein EV664_107139 [Stakelama pacifica]GGO96415.1 hypothetical protein GCM10011329_22890 [Stakelama pacifica]